MKMKMRVLAWLMCLVMLTACIPAFSDEVSVDFDEFIEEVPAAEEPVEIEAEPEAEPEIEAESEAPAEPELLLRELKDVAVGEAFAVDFMYTGEGELSFTWQTKDETLVNEELTEEEIEALWTDAYVGGTFTVEEYAPATAYRVVVTDGALTAVSTEAHVIAPEAEEEEAPAEEEAPVVEEEAPVEEEEAPVEEEEAVGSVLDALLSATSDDEQDIVIEGEEIAEAEESEEEEAPAEEEEEELVLGEGEEAPQKHVFSVGETVELNGFLPEGTTNVAISSGKTYATITPEGEGADTVWNLTAKAVGTAKYKITYGDGLTRTDTVTIKKKITSITFSPAAINVAKGDKATVTVKFNSGADTENIIVKSADEANVVVTQESDNKKILSVSALDVLDAPVAVIVTAGGMSKSFNVTCYPEVRKIVLHGPDAPFIRNMSYTYTWETLDENDAPIVDAEGKPVGNLVFHSDNEAIAKIDAKTGKVTAVGATAAVSVANITASCGSVVGTGVITVYDAAPATVNLAQGEKYAIVPNGGTGAPSGLKFSSSKASVASVDADTGIVTVKAKTGSATITIKSVGDDGTVWASTTCKVTAKPAPGKLTVTLKNPHIAAGDSETATYKFKSNDTDNIAFKVQEGFEDCVNVVPDFKNNKIKLVALKGSEAQFTIDVFAGSKTGEAPNADNCLQKASFTLRTYPEIKSVDVAIKITDDRFETEDAISGKMKRTIVWGGCSDEAAQEPIFKLDENGELIYNKTTGMPEPVGHIKFAISNKAAATLSSTASTNAACVTMTGAAVKKTQTAEVTATIYKDGVATEVSCKPMPVTTYIAPTSVKLDRTSATVHPGDILALVAVTNAIKNGDGSLTPAVFTASTSAKAVTGEIIKIELFDVQGMATYGIMIPENAKIGKTATITIKTHNGKSATCKVTVKGAPSDMDLTSVPNRAIAVGESVTLKATYSPKNTSAATYWESSDTSIATVTNGGKVTAKAPGTVTISAGYFREDGTETLYEGIEGEPKLYRKSCTIRVLPAATKFSMYKNTLDVSVGMQYALTQDVDYALATADDQPAAKKLTFKSANAKIATVTSAGVIKGVKKGSTTITMSFKNGSKTVSKKITVKVAAAPKSVYFADEKGNKITETTLVKGASKKLIVKSDSGVPVSCTYAVSDADILSVSGDTLLGLKLGEATVTVTANGKFKATLKVTVVNSGEEEKPAEEDDFTYTESNGKITITGYTGDDTRVVIPASIDGKPVVAIGAEAFKGKTQLQQIVVPEGVTTIGAGAFADCGEYLQKVTLPESVTYIADDAFSGSTAVKIIAPEGSEAAKFAEEKGMTDENTYGDFEYNAASTGVTITKYLGRAGKVTVPEKIKDLPITEIGESAFENNTYITAVNLPDTVEVIGAKSFKGCTNLKSMN